MKKSDKEMVSWAPCSGGGMIDISGSDPQMVSDELDKIKQSNEGILTAPLVVDAAKDASSPLHDLFEWDDDLAADKYRLNQARNLIKLIYIQFAPGAPKVSKYVNIVSVRDDGKTRRYYEETQVVFQDVTKRERYLRKAWNDLERWRKKYEAFDELASIFAAMDEASSEVQIKA